MAIGRKTDPIRVATIKAMAELGFEAGLIAELLKLARQTVADIVKGRGWLGSGRPRSGAIGETSSRGGHFWQRLRAGDDGYEPIRREDKDGFHMGIYRDHGSPKQGRRSH